MAKTKFLHQDINHQDENGNTMLHECFDEGEVRNLLRNGIDWTIANDDGLTAPDIVNLRLEEARDKRGKNGEDDKKVDTVIKTMTTLQEIYLRQEARQEDMWKNAESCLGNRHYSTTKLNKLMKDGANPLVPRKKDGMTLSDWAEDEYNRLENEGGGYDNDENLSEREQYDEERDINVDLDNVEAILTSVEQSVVAKNDAHSDWLAHAEAQMQKEEFAKSNKAQYKETAKAAPVNNNRKVSGTGGYLRS